MSHERVEVGTFTFTLHYAQDGTYGWMCDVCGATESRTFSQEQAVDDARTHLRSEHGA